MDPGGEQHQGEVHPCLETTLHLVTGLWKLHNLHSEAVLLGYNNYPLLGEDQHFLMKKVMRWDGKGWEGMRRNGMGWDVRGWDGMGWDGMGRNGLERIRMGVS